MLIDHPLPELLAEHSSEMAVIRPSSLSQELVDLVGPDVVFFEMTERLLSGMGAQSGAFFQSMAAIRQNGSYMDIYYSDFGCFPQMWFPTWSEENGQDDLVWYQAERSDENTWHVQVDLSAHRSGGIYNVHIYQGNIEPTELITAHIYEVEDFIYTY